MLGAGIGDLPEFGFKPRVPLTSGFVERTEVDMKLGSVLFEAKLTESGFQTQNARIVEGYRDLKEVFERSAASMSLINCCGMCSPLTRSTYPFACCSIRGVLIWSKTGITS